MDRGDSMCLSSAEYNKNLYHQVNAHYTFPVIVIESDPLGGFKKPVHC